LVPYEGTYFSDSPAVALWAGTRAVEAFGGKHIIVICGITHDLRDELAGDEDGITEFIDSFDADDYRDNSDEEERSELECWDIAFYQAFEMEAPQSFFKLLDHPSDSDPLHRKYMDQVTRYIGASTRSSGSGNGDVSFRVPNGVGLAHIAAIIECEYSDDFDPSHLPSDFRYKVIYGKLNQTIKRKLS
jgi:hypothetical protein